MVPNTNTAASSGVCHNCRITHEARVKAARLAVTESYGGVPEAEYMRRLKAYEDMLAEFKRSTWLTLECRTYVYESCHTKPYAEFTNMIWCVECKTKQVNTIRLSPISVEQESSINVNSPGEDHAD